MTIDPKEALERLTALSTAGPANLRPYQDHNGFEQHERLQADLRTLITSHDALTAENAFLKDECRDDETTWKATAEAANEASRQLVVERDALAAEVETYEAEEGAISVLYASERVKRQGVEAKLSALAEAAQKVRQIVLYPTNDLMDANSRLNTTASLLINDTLLAVLDPTSPPGRALLDPTAPVEAGPPCLHPDDLLRRQDVIDMLARLANHEADTALYGEPDNARQREASEAALTNARVAVALMPAAQSESGLHPATATMIDSFALALKGKLRAAEVKYGHGDGWRADDWADKCRADLLAHVHKGDPRDVAAYAAFCWAHGWSTTPAQPHPNVSVLSNEDRAQLVRLIERQRPGNGHCGESSGDRMDRDRLDDWVDRVLAAFRLHPDVSVLTSRFDVVDDSVLAAEIHAVAGCQVGSWRTEAIIKWHRRRLSAAFQSSQEEG